MRCRVCGGLKLDHRAKTLQCPKEERGKYAYTTYKSRMRDVVYPEVDKLIALFEADNKIYTVLELCRILSCGRTRLRMILKQLEIKTGKDFRKRIMPFPREIGA